MKPSSPDKYRDTVERMLPAEAKKYAPLVLGRVKAHLGSLSRDENCYHTVVGTNALLKAWQKWQEKKEQYTEAQFLVLAKAYVRGYLLNHEDSEVASEKFARQTNAALQRYAREDKEDDERDIRESQARALRNEPPPAPTTQTIPFFEISHYRFQLLPTREQAFMRWMQWTGSVAGASKEMNLTRQAGNDIKRSAEKILEGYEARFAGGESYWQLRQEAESKRKPGRYDVFLQAAIAKETRQASAYQLAPLVDEDGEAAVFMGEDDYNSDDYDDWQHDLMVNEACYREDILRESSNDERYG